jgi:myo-inositol-1(or 4)-monophosphatase
VAAGSLIVQEAQGAVTDFNNQPFNLNHKETLATNGLIHSEMMALLLREVM